MRTALVFGLTLLMASAAVHAQPGKSGYTFLKLGVSARGVAMGDAMTATASGAAATHYNPAGLLHQSAVAGGTELMFMHREWIQQTRSEFLGSSIILGEYDAIGFALNTTTVSDIEVRTRPGEPEATFTARDLALSASYALGISPELQLGITGKFLYQKIFVDEATGFAFDLGGQWSTPLEGLRLGLALANIGSAGSLRTEKTTLPALGRTGAAYSFRLDALNADAVAGADGVYIFPENRLYGNFGGELVFAELVAARVGYQAGSESRGLTFGVGVYYKFVGLDYSFARLTSELGNAHTISLRVGM